MSTAKRESEEPSVKEVIALVGRFLLSEEHHAENGNEANVVHGLFAIARALEGVARAIREGSLQSGAASNAYQPPGR